jgi:hypothetical protein
LFNEHARAEMPEPNQSLIDFEEAVQLDAKRAALLLGIGRSTYSHYRSGLRPLPQYHHYHMQDLAALSAELLRKRIKERT